MKYIQKNSEPSSLTQWNSKRSNQTKNWKSFNKSVKDDVAYSLLNEQGYICCYCGISISRRKSHIEHYRPKSKYTHLTFEYKNLISSCQGEDEQRPTKPVHCGHKKGGWFDEELMISPQDPNCEKYFKYSGSGDIIPSDNPDIKEAAETTIQYLALNINKLKKMRRVAIDAALFAVEGLSEEEVKQLARAYQQRDEDGRYTPFSAVIGYVLQQYFVG